MFAPLTQAELDALYLEFGKADDDLIHQIQEEFNPPAKVLELEAVMTSVPKVVASGPLAPLALIDAEHEYIRDGSYIVVKTRPGMKASREVQRIGVGQCMAFYSTQSHIPVGETYQVRQSQPSDVRVPLPPSRRDATVTGQLKLLVDVVLMLPHVRQTDKVWVVGSANTVGARAAEVYQLLESSVNSIVLIDPQQPSFREQRGTTFVQGMTQEWKEAVYCDVFFNDAAIRNGDTVKNVIIPFEAREFSVKCAGDDKEQIRTVRAYKHMEKKFFPYVQVSNTFERRLVSQPRRVGRYRPRLGTCGACVEMDYCLPYDFQFTDHQYKVIRDIHAYGETHCSMRMYSRPQGQVWVNTLLMRTTSVLLTLSSDCQENMGEGVPYSIQDRNKIVNPAQLHGSSLDIDQERYYFVSGEEQPPASVMQWCYPHPMHLRIPDHYMRNSIYFISTAAGRGSGTEAKKSRWGLLVVDTYVYDFAYVPGKKIEGFKMFPTPEPIGQCWVSRFGTLLWYGLTAASLAGQLTTLMRNHMYRNFGYWGDPGSRVKQVKL